MNMPERVGALDVALQRWALRRSGSAALARAIGLAVAAEADGHACVRLGADIDPGELAMHPWVGDGSELKPCVLTPSGDFFLWRNWRHEQRIAAEVAARISAAQAVDSEPLQADLDLLHAGMDPQQVAGQRLAVQSAMGKKLFVLSGGPGTGKTSTVLRLLLMLQRHGAHQGEIRIALAAPTGKAAQRLSQALREGKQALAASLADRGEGWAEALKAIPESAQTLHRLLGFQPQHDRFRFDRDQRLPHQIVVIDEASMVDLALMRASFDALADEATLILLGDPDQLVSVSAGSVLADLVSAAAAEPALGGHHAQLSHVWRAGGTLARIYAAIRRGAPDELQSLLAADAEQNWYPTDDPAALARQLQRWLGRPEWLAMQAQLTRADVDPHQAFAEMRQLQLLCALRSGRYGATELNAWIDAQRRQRLGGTLWYPGRPVLIRHNDYGRRLYNGDVGLTLPIGGELRVCFESLDADGALSLRTLSPRELPEHELAYALTIHQAQGSEYGHVAVLLPPDASSRILSRQLLYTGVSRAKRSVEIWSSAASLQAALNQLSLRAGGLRERLTHAQDDPL
ncbi:MAG: exodeoxyribonuclease V subunit alpha [Lysobacterales bacterium]